MTRAATAAGALAAAMSLGFALAVRATPLEQAEIAAICKEADGLAHCGRLVEAVQLARAQHVAVRDGARLVVRLYPSGEAVFEDSDTADGGRSFSVWDYQDTINAVVLYATRGDDAHFVLLQRESGRTTELAAEPRLSPDRQRLVTADFCETRCVNELAVWRITRAGVRKEAVWAPRAPWADAAAHWTAADTLAVDYTPAGSSDTRRITRRLADPDWRRLPN